MGWIDKAKEAVMRLKEFGKSEQEIEGIVNRAADAATVTQNAPAASPYEQVKHNATNTVDAFTYAVSVFKAYAENAAKQGRRNTNNWRRLHGLPMHRERAARRSERNGKAAGKNCRTKDI